MLNNNIKTSFSIKDLENLSGIKAHTIRIWEKRYSLLEPNRSDSNIRRYDIVNMQRLLNVAYLNKHGHKISAIAKLNEGEISSQVREVNAINKTNGHAIDQFKLAMINFDQSTFDATYLQLLNALSFREIFINVMVPLLEEIGLLWQTNTITPAHEHFISNLIKQKILINIERVQSVNISKEKTFVLFLPLNEIHDLGLLYIQYELTLKGYHAVYLGQSVPIENLLALQKTFVSVDYISYFTVSPPLEDVAAYIHDIEQQVLNNTGEKLHLLGRNTVTIKSANANVFCYKNIPALINNL